MAPSVLRPDPPFQQIAAHLREQILSGELREGDRLPSSRQLTRDWHVAIATACKALAVLRSEGYTRVIPGVGTVVRASGTLRHASRDRLLAFRRDGRIYPPGERAIIMSAEVVVAPPHVADALALRKGADVIQRHRITSRNDRLVTASTSWFDADVAEVAPLLLVTSRILDGTAAYVAECTGRFVSSGRDQFSVGDVSATEAAELAVAVGSAVLRGRSWFYDGAGTVLEFGESATVPGRWTTLDYELAEPSGNTGDPGPTVTPRGR